MLPLVYRHVVCFLTYRPYTLEWGCEGLMPMRLVKGSMSAGLTFCLWLAVTRMDANFRGGKNKCLWTEETS